MKPARTLLRTPELVRALGTLVSVPVTPKDIFRLIGDGLIQPCGYIQRVPVFDIEQLGDIAKQLSNNKDTVLEDRKQ